MACDLPCRPHLAALNIAHVFEQEVNLEWITAAGEREVHNYPIGPTLLAVRHSLDLSMSKAIDATNRDIRSAWRLTIVCVDTTFCWRRLNDDRSKDS